ncbi:hypothetical protein K9L97_00630 [Candidatus Woesearchaeota archaeon]|nr:hypothetical protein [Candidatus Woesearchaeota archaeon]
MQKELKEIGLTNSEINVYLALLDLGDSTKHNITTKSNVTGSKTYEILERLKQKGLISTYTKNKVKHFKAANPKQIKYYLEEKQQKIKETENKINSILPQLLMKFNSSEKDEEVELYTGLKGLQIIFREQIDILNPEDYNYVIGGTKGTDEAPVLAFFQKIHKLRAEKKIKTKMLYNTRQKKSVEEQFAKYKYTEVKYIKHTSPVAINIYKERTVIIIFGNKISAIMIKSKDVSNSFKEYFNMLWK